MSEHKTTKPSVRQTMLVLLMVCILAYLVCRAVFVGYANYPPSEKLLAVLFFLAEGYVMFHAFAYFTGIYRISKRKNTQPETVELTSFPSVAILIPARHEPKEVLEETIAACYNLSYPEKTIYVLDDSSQESYKAEAEELAEKYGCRLFRRQHRHGYKAGVINDCLKTLKEKYIAIFDVDQNPIDGFLAKTVSIIEADDELALVQTPQYYSNLHESKVAFAANMQQAVFYEYVCEAKDAGGAMICCGTNVVLRRTALEEVGGLDESTVTEDFATSFELHIKGWKTLYYNHINTFGRGPKDLAAHLVQQNRWSHGNVSVLRKVLWRLLRSPSALSAAQWWEYVVTGSYYLVSWAYVFLILCPVLYVFFSIPSFFMDPVVYALSFLPYITLASLIFYSSMARRGYSFSQAVKGQLLLFMSLPTYLRGSLFGLVTAKQRFRITSKAGTSRVGYIQLWPQLLLWSISLSAIIWGASRFAYSYSPAVAVNVVWIMYHFLLLSSLFYFNEK